jgi:four helix bundle protein
MVEGIARQHHRDRIRFVNIAGASLTELGYGLHACHRLGYIDEPTYAGLEKKLRYIGAPLRGLIRKAQSDSQEETARPAPPGRVDA